MERVGQFRRRASAIGRSHSETDDPAPIAPPAPALPGGLRQFPLVPSLCPNLLKSLAYKVWVRPDLVS
jgi:hypothetical protein